jgi:arylsulfatase A-like enzyme
MAFGTPLLAQTTRPKNIVLILADDLGYGDVTCYNPESKLPTPHIDRLAREGMRFTDAHSGDAVCSPTRYGLLTGRYAWRTRLKRHVLEPYDPPLIEAGRQTLASLLRGQGYKTACIGKWHLGWNWAPGAGDHPDFTKPIADGPLTRGFDYYFGTHVPNHSPYCFIENDRTVGQPTAWKPVRDLDGRPGPMLPGWRFEEILPRITARAVQYVRERAADKQPFFLYWPLTSPHEPIRPTKEFAGKTGIHPVADFLLQTDAAVGEVLRELDRSGLAEDTLVIFTADNGPAQHGWEEMARAGQKRAGPFRGRKTQIYEGGHRVPFVARWPGRIRANSVSDRPVSLVDTLATVAELMAVPLARDAGEDSFSFAPVLLGKPAPARPPFVAHANTQFALRDGKWKLIVPHELGKIDWRPEVAELYDLAADPAETTNVREAHAGEAKRLAQVLKRYEESGRSRV